MAKRLDAPTRASENQVVALDERRLLPRHRRGDASAFGELLQAYRAPVYGYLVRCGVPAAARDDIFQDIFLKVHAAASTYQPDRPLKPWLFTIVANTVRTFYRKARVQQLVFGEGGESAPAKTIPSDVVAESKQTARWVHDCLEQMPFAQREVVILSTIEQLALKDVAKVLDIPVGTVKTHLHRGRLTLAKALAKRNAVLARESGDAKTEGEA